MKTKIMIIVLLAILAGTGATYIAMKGRTGSPVKAGAGHSDHEPESPALDLSGIKSAVAQSGEGWDRIEATGRITVPPDGLVKVGPRIDGKVVAAYGTVGDSVRRGQVLAVVSSVELAEARAEFRRAQAKLSAAQRNYDRESEMVKLGAVSERPVEEARSEQLSAQGDLSDAKSDLALATSEFSQAEGELALCRSRLNRSRELYKDQIVSRQDLESAEAEYKRDSTSVEAARGKISSAEARIQKTKSRAEIAAQYLAREQKLYKGKTLDARALQAARSELEAARIEAQSAADRVRVLGADPGGSGETLVVASPISGKIISRDTNIGQMASPSDSLFTIANQDRVWIEADVHEKDLAKVRRGQKVEMQVDAYPDSVFSGRVDSIGDILSPETRTAKVRCVVNNSNGRLRGEMFARVSLLTGRRGRTVLVPREAVLDDAGKKVVFIKCADCPEDKQAGRSVCGEFDKRDVTTGATRGGKTEIVKGVEPGTEVVTTGAAQLKSALGSGKLEAGCSDH